MKMTDAVAFKKLKRQAARMKHPDMHLKRMWERNPQARANMCVQTDQATFDYSYENLTPQVMATLIELAVEMGLAQHILARFGGEIINRTEGRAVGHHALRAPTDASFVVNGEEQMPLVHDVLDKLEHFSNNVINGNWRGCTGKKIDKIVSIGIGGSKYGPEVLSIALKDYATNGIESAFISNVDPANLDRVLNELNPETTLFVIESKSFTTAETVESNAKSARDWMLQKLNGKAPVAEIVSKHFVAVSTATELVTEFGIDHQNMFEFWNWVGGRVSLWSAIGGAVLGPVIGFDNFRDVLAGGHWADQQYQTAPFDQNISVLNALTRIWNRTLLGRQNLALVPYSYPLRDAVFLLTQLIMESLGKGVDINNKPINFVPSSSSMGDAGSDAQHSFFQYLHQIPEKGIIPLELLGFLNASGAEDRIIQGRNISHHDRLMANLLAQRRALAFGKENLAEPHKHFPGNRPSSLTMFNERTPFTIAAYIALQENTVDAEGAIQRVPAYDQEGVQEGKRGAKQLEAIFEVANRGKPVDLSDLDLSTRRYVEARLARQLPTA